jgi:DNA-binding LacI/PurR family transcriptional regulator
MASGKTKNIGVVYAKGVLYSGEPFYSRVLQGIEREANHEDHHVLLTTVDSESRSHSSFLSALRSRKIDGAIVIGMIPSDTILELEQTGVPFVLIDFDIPRTPYARVLIDNRHGIDQVVDYLYGMGHRKVGFIGAEMDLPSIAERAETFERALAQRSMPQFDGWRTKGNLTSPSGFQACQHIMEQSQRPSAIISVNDEMAIGAMKYCQQAGIELPKDLSLVGFDNIEWSQHCYPALTTVNVPKEKMGKHAVMILLDMIQQTPASSPQEQAEAGPCVLVKTKLIIRDSVMRWSEPEKTGR